MEKELFLKYKKVIFITVFIAIVALFFLLLNFLYKSKREIKPIPVIPIPTPITTQPSHVHPLQRTVVGKTTDKEISENPTIKKDILKKEVLPDGQTQYSLKSPIDLVRPNEVVTQNGVVVRERLITRGLHDFPRISLYKRMYGAPDKLIEGSKFYGEFMQTHIYARLGFAFLANPVTDEIHEFHVFKPTSAENYINQYGQDLDPGAKPPQEGPIFTDQEIAVMAFKDELPYYGNNFAVLYDKSYDKTDVFIFGNVVEGEKGFDEYLRRFGVENRSWINNMEIHR